MRVILCLKNRRVKSQIPSTKLQIILKFQFLMTKTFGIWNFGSCYLFGICYLGFVISRFSLEPVSTESRLWIFYQSLS